MSALLSLEAVRSGYGEAVVVDGLDLALMPGEAMALLGRNGTGKTTLVETVIGLTTLMAGRIRFAGADVTRHSAARRAQAGIGWVPQERGVFRSLSVEENLTAVARPGAFGLERVYGLFPRLRERRRNLGNQLSGGEQQMLAVGRALMLNPTLLLLDEPLEGLAPIIVDELLAAIRAIVRDEGLSAIIVEQKARKILPLTERAVILDRGQVVWSGTSAALAGDPDALDRHLSVTEAPMH